MKTIYSTIFNLQQSNQKAYALAFLRVALSVWFLKELYFRYPAFEVLYSNSSFLNIKPDNAIHLFKLNIHFLRTNYWAVTGCCIAFASLNILGIGRHFTGVGMYISFTLLRAMNIMFGNTGEEVCLILAFYLCFANSFDHFVLFKSKPLSPQLQKLYHLISNLAAYSIIINLCVAYFYTGYFKLENHFWRTGLAMHYSWYNERFNAFEYSKLLAEMPVVYYFFNYLILAFELSFGFLIWFKPWRNWLLIFGLIMHSYIYCTMLIFGMTLTFLMQYPMFLENEEIEHFLLKIKSFVVKLRLRR